VAALGERGVGGDAQRIEAMVARHGPMLLRVANQFSLCHDDALDAYQRALEIYLRRLGTIDRATEGAWLRVVVKHEAMAIRRARAGSVEVEELDLDEREGAARELDDRLAGGERVERSVEALKALKPDEARALLAKAEGLSYDEIGRRFGWTYTKVNRSIAEGRKRFLKVYDSIETGAACERYRPVLDALADGTATSAHVLSIRPHLRHCSPCRATVRSMRFSRARRIALLAPFAWLSRILNRTDVMQYASSGGGRLGPVASVIGLCLGGVGAGAACVMTGALPAAPIITHHASAPKVAEHKVVAKKKVRPKPHRTPVPTATAAPTTAASLKVTPTATAAPKQQTVKAKTAREHVVRVTKKKQRKPQEFSFEGTQPAGGTPTRSTVTASAASTSTGSSSTSTTTHKSSGGGGGSGGGAKKAGGGEFGFEGG
jgi:RNA polymerase sigma factor (sigma-70 family)